PLRRLPPAVLLLRGRQPQGRLVGRPGAHGVTTTEFLPAPVPRRLARLRGSLEELLTSPRFTDAEDAWVQATLTDEVRPVRAMERLRARFPHALQLAFAANDLLGSGAPGAMPTPGRSDHQVALDFVAEVRGVPASVEEAALLQDACDACSPDRDLEREAG